MISKEQIEQLSQLIQNVNPDKHYWFFRTMGGHFYDEFVSMGFIAIGYDDILMKDLKDLPEQDYMARAFIKIRLHELKNEMTDSQIAKAAGQIVKFYKELHIGDIIVAPDRQSRKFAIGVIASDMYEDSSKHGETECPFVKRRSVKWIKEVWRHELDAKAILAFGNQQTMSSIDDYADYIDRKMDQLYTKGDASYLVLRVNQDKELSWEDFMFIGELGAFFKEFSKEIELGADLSRIKMKINVQSPGDILLMIPDGGGWILVIVLLILMVIRGGKSHININSNGLDAGVEAEDMGDTLRKVLEAISNFRDRNVERSLLIKRNLENMDIEQPKDTQDVILLDESETIALPPSLSESEDSTEHDELPELPQK